MCVYIYIYTYTYMYAHVCTPLVKRRAVSLKSVCLMTNDNNNNIIII